MYTVYILQNQFTNNDILLQPYKSPEKFGTSSYL